MLPHCPAVLSFCSVTRCCCYTFWHINDDYIILYDFQQITVFLPRDALVHSAVLRLHVVRLSVCLSVTLVDQDLACLLVEVDRFRP